VRGIERQIRAFVNCAKLAREAGYDGVEVMGSEGYFINQFLVTHTNHRTDEWGGVYTNRMRLAVEIVRRIREAVGPDFILIYRISLIDLIPDGSSWSEVLELARAISAAGATLLNTGIGWHEARIPTIATSVPRAAFSWVTHKLRDALRSEGNLIPVITSNRINMPEVAESVLVRGDADMVSMARPFLADPQFVVKAATGRRDEINTCIACNQACLDHTFSQKMSSCLVNPRACHETELLVQPAAVRKRFAVVGAGPAGLAASTTLAQRGHEVHLFDAAEHIGGQFNMAKTIPGKEEFHETLRYFARHLETTGVHLHLNQRVHAEDLVAQKFDAVLLATGVTPRSPNIAGQEHPDVLTYVDVLLHKKPVGRRVGILGAGGIGFDVAEYLSNGTDMGMASTTHHLEAWLQEWGVGDPQVHRGGWVKPKHEVPAREVTLLQRKPGRAGQTGWIHRATLKMKNVQMITGVQYEQIGPLAHGQGLGLAVTHGDSHQDLRVLEFDTLVLCTGQEPLRDLQAPLQAAGVVVHLLGGAFEAGELDAKRAIDMGTRLAARL
jgi:2,4-dienoyl-CoA reductase (NADPH2)